MITVSFTITREEGLWVALGDGPIGGGLSAKRLAALKSDIAKLVPHAFPDQPGETFDIVYTYELPGVPGAALEEFMEAKRDKERAEGVYGRAQAEAVKELARAGISQREAADLLEISPARVHQVQHAG